MGEGGWQEVLYEVRDRTKNLAEHHTTLANTLEQTVVRQLEGIRADIKAHISAIEKEAGALAIEVDKEVSIPSYPSQAATQELTRAFRNSAPSLLVF